MVDLIIDLGLLSTLHQDLDAIGAEFKNADDFSDSVAAATGHDDLAGHVRDFAHKWNDKRKDMTEKVENLTKSVGAITDGFTKVDDGLAKALEDGDAKSRTQGVAKP
jgi:ABC-type transporter Mla subunit MlaD